MFIGADARGQNLGYGGIGYDGKAEIYAAGSIGVPLVGDKPAGQNKGENSVLVIDEVFTEVAGLDAAERHGCAGCKAEGENRGGYVRAEGNEARVPADLHAGLNKLLGKARPVIA